MDVIKRKISFEPATVRYTGGTVPYGTMTADTFYIKIMLTQNADDMGIYTDINFEEEDKNGSQPDYTILINKLSSSGFTFPFMLGGQPQPSTQPINTTDIRVTGKELADYWAYASKITGATDSKITDVRSYSKLQNYISGFDVDKTPYTNYVGANIDGRTRVTALNTITTSNFKGRELTGTTYVFDANNDVNIGTDNQTSGILYKDFSGNSRTVINEIGAINSITLTEMEFIGEGWNETNTSLSAITKEEYLFGITERPEVYSDVFIDRGDTTVFEKHLRFSEIESLEHLERYNNGFYKLVKQ